MAMSPRNNSGNSLYQPMPEINVVPLVDIMLVLLIVFMITAPMLSAGLKVDLPQARTAEPLDPRQPIVITVTKEGELTVGDQTVAREDMAAEVRRSSMERIATFTFVAIARSLMVKSSR